MKSRKTETFPFKHNPEKELGNILANELSNVASTNCPSSEEIATLIDRKMTAEKREQIMQHISSCDLCYDSFILALDLHEDASSQRGEAREVKKQKAPLIIFRPMAMAASILIVIVSLYLFFKIDIPKTPRAFIEMESPEKKLEEKSKIKTPSLEDSFEEKEPKAKREESVKKPAQQPSVVSGLSDPSALKEVETGGRAITGKDKKERVPKRDRLKTKSDDLGISPSVDRSSPIESHVNKNEQNKKSSITSPEPSPPESKKKSHSQNKKHISRGGPVSPKYLKEEGFRDIGLEKNLAWSQANLINLQIQQSPHPITGSDLRDIFKQTLDLSFQLKESYKKIQKEAEESGNAKKMKAFIQGISPLIIIKPQEKGINIYPNIGYFLAKSKPDSIEHQFFNLARNGWCEASSGCFNMHKSKINSTEEIISAKQKPTQLIKWQILLPQLKGIFHEIAYTTMRHLENKGKTMGNDQ